MSVYGYMRVATRSQSMERQKENILSMYPDAILCEEKYTGTKIEGREVFERLYKRAKKNDTIVFFELSRMSRYADVCFEIYKKLLDKGLKIVFIKESYLNSEIFTKSITGQTDKAGNLPNRTAVLMNDLVNNIIKEQIKSALDISIRETEYLQKRTREGLAASELKSGAPKGKPHRSLKRGKVREAILKNHRDFGGTMKDSEIMELIHVSKPTYCKYKRELLDDLAMETT